MGKAISKIPVVGNMIGGILNGPQDIQAARLDAGSYDISKEVQPAQNVLTSQLTAQTGLAAQTNPQTAAIMNQMAMAAQGKGPSLAETQMKAAQERSLSQQLAATQSLRGGSASANQRSLVNSMASSGRDIEQQAAQARLQERSNFLNQANTQTAQLGSAAQQQMAAAIAPKQAMQNYSAQQAGLTQQANIANTQAQNQYTGALIGAAGSIGAKMFSPSAAAPTGATGGLLSKQNNSISNTNKISYEKGGSVSGPGTATSDSVPAQLSDGEFVIKAKVVKKPGMLEHLRAINEGKIEPKPMKKGRGGMVDAYMAGQGYMDGGPVTTYMEDGGSVSDAYHKAARSGSLGTAPRINENVDDSKYRGMQDYSGTGNSDKDVRTPEQKQKATEISAQYGYAKGGEVHEDTDAATEVKPDKGFGKIIIIDNDKDGAAYADGGLVDPAAASAPKTGPEQTGGLGELLKVNYADQGGQHMARHGHGSNLHTPAVHKGLAKALMAKAELHSTLAAELSKSKQKKGGPRA